MQKMKTSRPVKAKTTKVVPPPLSKEDQELFAAKETPGKMKKEGQHKDSNFTVGQPGF